MGLTIHYSLHAPHVQNFQDARALIKNLHTFAKSLPIKHCTKLITYIDGKDDPMFGQFRSYLLMLPHEPDDERPPHLFVPPLELVEFDLQQPGSESAAFGLARYPATASSEEFNLIDHPTGLTNWRWRVFCKTQYASLEKEGGFANFFAIHDGICQVLDEAKRLGIESEVLDESNYFEHRDKTKLEAEINKWNRMIAGFTGALKDAYRDRPDAVQSPITQTPEYERLEAQGQEFAEKARGIKENIDRDLKKGS
jgi:hypothetical protein